jgi:ketol-acid reductoisomerase
MATVYYEEHGDLAVLKNKTIAVIGFGNQGRAQALNLRDSGLTVIVGNRADEAGAEAEAEGFEVCEIPEAVKRGDVVMLLFPDEVMPEVFAGQIEPNLKDGACMDFASGYNIGFELIEPPEGIDVIMVAPRMIGPGVRDSYVEGSGFPSFVAVHQDASGKSKDIMLALAKGLGTLKAGALELESMRMEAELDLFTEQAFGPAFGRVLLSAIETELEAGYPVEAVMLELLMSGEFAYSIGKIVEVGMIEQMNFHSQTSQYGSMTRGARFMDMPVKEKMQQALEEIRSGAFAKEWQAEKESGMEKFNNLVKFRKLHPINEWEKKTREAFRTLKK